MHELHYPPLLLEKVFDPNFAIRGLHFDLRRGILLKLTFLGDVVSGAAYLGRRSLDDSVLEQIYPGMHIPQSELAQHFKHYVEPGALVDTTLVADVVHLFHTTGRPFHPHYVFQDVANAVAATMREDIPLKLATAPDTVLQPKQVHDLLVALRATGRRTFLLTNADFAHVDVVMRHLCRNKMQEPESWPEKLFDIVICNAGRPGWFKSDVPFRSFNSATNKVRWLPVAELRSGHVYVGGSASEFMRLAGGSYRDVLYTSALPHVYGAPDCYADLSLPSSLGWRTGAIVAEVRIRRAHHRVHRPEAVQLAPGHHVGGPCVAGGPRGGKRRQREVQGGAGEALGLGAPEHGGCARPAGRGQQAGPAAAP